MGKFFLFSPAVNDARDCDPRLGDLVEKASLASAAFFSGKIFLANPTFLAR